MRGPKRDAGAFALLGLTAVVVIVGGVVRLWIMDAPMGALDADSAVPGLMALRIRHGELSTFYWGQAYGGPAETVVAGLLFLVLSPSVFLVKLVPVLFNAGAIVLVWRVGCRLVGERAARIGALLLWVWPVSFLWWSTKMGGYQASLFLSLLALLLVLRLVQGEEPWRGFDVALLGLVSGLAFWSNVQAVYILAPAFLWYGSSFVRQWRRLPLLVVGFALGASPWIRYNVLYDWASLRQPPAPATSYESRFEGFFHFTLPQALGLRHPFSLDWVSGRVGQVLYASVLILFAVGVAQVVRRRVPGLGVPVLTALVYPFVYAASTFSFSVGHPRYLLFLTPAIGLLLGRLVMSLPWTSVPAVALVAAAAVSSVVGLGPMNEGPVTLAGILDVRQPASFDDLNELLRAGGVRYAFADYWISYRVMFETEERTAVTPFYSVRNPEIDAEVRASSNPAYIFPAASRKRAEFEERARALGVGYATHTRGEFAVLVPERRLLPEELGISWVT